MLEEESPHLLPKPQMDCREYVIHTQLLQFRSQHKIALLCHPEVSRLAHNPIFAQFLFIYHVKFILQIASHTALNYSINTTVIEHYGYLLSSILQKPHQH